GKPVSHLVYDFQSGSAQHARLPKRQHSATQGLVACRPLLRSEANAIAFRQEMRNLHLAIDRALAPHLGRVSGEHRANDGIREEVLQLGPGNSRITGANKRVGHSAFARCRTGQRMDSGPTNVMLVFRNVGKMRKVAERTDDLDALSMREAVQHRLELVPRGFILVAMEAYRGLANALNDCKNSLAFLAANRITKNAAEKPDIVA